MAENYYSILGLSRNATTDQIKKAYKELALKYHPDHNHSPEAETIMRQLNQAKETLLNCDSKAKYDSNCDDLDDEDTAVGGFPALVTGPTLSADFTGRLFPIWEKEFSTFQFTKLNKQLVLDDGNITIPKTSNDPDFQPQIPTVVEQKIKCSCSSCSATFLSANQAFLHEIKCHDPSIRSLSTLLDSYGSSDFTAEMKSAGVQTAKISPLSTPHINFLISLNDTKLAVPIFSFLESMISRKDSNHDSLQFEKSWESMFFNPPSRVPLVSPISAPPNQGVSILEDIVQSNSQPGWLFRFWNSIISPEPELYLGQTVTVWSSPIDDLQVRSTVSMRVPPLIIPNPNATCSSCDKQVGIRIRQNCRGCGKICCCTCLEKRTLPLMGFLTPVLICESCKSQARIAESRVILAEAEKLASLPEDSSKKDTTQVLKGLKLIILLQQSSSMRPSKQDWDVYVEKWCKEQSLLHLAVVAWNNSSKPKTDLLRVLERAFTGPPQSRNPSIDLLRRFLMFNAGNSMKLADWERLAQSIGIDPEQDSTTVIQLFRQAQLKSEDWINKAIEYDLKSMHLLSWLCTVEASIKSTTYSDSLFQLSLKKSPSVAMQILRLADIKLNVHQMIVDVWSNFETLGKDLVIRLTFLCFRHLQSVGNQTIQSRETLWIDLAMLFFKNWKNSKQFAVAACVGIFCLHHGKVESLKCWLDVMQSFISINRPDIFKIAFAAFTSDFGTVDFAKIEPHITSSDFQTMFELVLIWKESGTQSKWNQIAEVLLQKKLLRLASHCCSIVETIESKQCFSFIDVAADLKSQGKWNDSLVLYVHDVIRRGKSPTFIHVRPICQCLQKINKENIAVKVLISWIKKNSGNPTEIGQSYIELSNLLLESHPFAALEAEEKAQLHLKQPVTSRAASKTRQFIQDRVQHRFKLMQVLFDNCQFLNLIESIIDHFPCSALDTLALEQFININIPDQASLQQRPIHQQCCLYILRGFRHLLGNTFFDAVVDFSQALLIFPEETLCVIPISKVLCKPVVRDSLCHQILNQVSSLLRNPGGIPRSDTNWLFGSPIKFPDVPVNFQGKLNSTPTLNVLRKSDKSIFKHLLSKPAEAAFAYLDLSMAANSLYSTIGCWMSSAHFWVHAIENLPDSQRKQAYVYKKAMLQCLLISFEISRTSGPYLVISVCRSINSLILTSSDLFQRKFNRSNTCSEEEATLLAMCASTIANSCAAFPLFVFPNRLFLSFDTVYSLVISREIYCSLLKNSLEIGESQALPIKNLKYLIFEGTLRGYLEEKEIYEEELVEEVCNSDEDTDSEIPFLPRIEAMDELLRDTNSTFDQVSQNLSFDKRAPGDWYSELRFPLFTSSYSRIHGFSIDLSNGKVEMDLELGNRQKPSLFDGGDISEIFSLKIGSSVFSLDEIDPVFTANPFQKMVFSPTTISGTSYLSTLFQADYLLKFFTSGSEVSSVFPFKVRSTETLLSRVRDHSLRKILAPLHIQEEEENRRHPNRPKRNNLEGKAHRFWIEAGEIPFQETRSDAVLHIRFDYVPMKVKKHLMTRDELGNLVDAVDDSSDDSIEAIFARNFTNNYDRIGVFFPEFLRLRELHKIAAMQSIIWNCAESLELNIQEAECKIRDQTIDYCSKISRNLQYPYSHDELERVVSQVANDALNDLKRQHRWETNVQFESLYSIKNKLRPAVREQLEKRDSELFSLIKDSFSTNFQVTPSDSLVSSFLRSKNSSQIVNLVLETHIQPKKRALNNIRAYFLQQRPPRAPTDCKWVPTAFCRDGNTTIVGGVAMPVSLKQVPVVNSATSNIVQQSLGNSISSGNNTFSNRTSSTGNGGGGVTVKHFQSSGQAYRYAKAFAQVPRESRGGIPIGLNASSKGANAAFIEDLRKTSGRPQGVYGMKNPFGKNEYKHHPDGHSPGSGDAAHHNQPHFHAVNSKGEAVVCTYGSTTVQPYPR